MQPGRPTLIWLQHIYSIISSLHFPRSFCSFWTRACRKSKTHNYNGFVQDGCMGREFRLPDFLLWPLIFDNSSAFSPPSRDLPSGTGNHFSWKKKLTFRDFDGSDQSSIWSWNWGKTVEWNLNMLQMLTTEEARCFIPCFFSSCSPFFLFSSRSYFFLLRL